MTVLTIAAVWTGDKYGAEYVSRLFAMVDRNLTIPHEKVCFTDHQKTELPLGVKHIPIQPYDLYGWWAKMALFNDSWRRGRQVVYLDLDTVIVGNIDILSTANTDAEFYIAGNFARRTSPTWPCRYGSAIMVINPWFDGWLWRKFNGARNMYIAQAGQYGDQKIIENLYPNAAYLQPNLPSGFFLDRRELLKHPTTPPPSARVVVFGGPLRPGNCRINWIRKAWTT